MCRKVERCCKSLSYATFGVRQGDDLLTPLFDIFVDVYSRYTFSAHINSYSTDHLLSKLQGILVQAKLTPKTIFADRESAFQSSQCFQELTKKNIFLKQ